MCFIALFCDVPLAPPDPIFHLTTSYNQDSFEKKVNVGVGAYLDDNGWPFVLPSVKKAEKIIVDDKNCDHSYLPIDGMPEFIQASMKLVLGKDSEAIASKRVK